MSVKQAFLVVVFIALAIAVANGRKTYPHLGNDCYFCPPGLHRINHCTDTQQTTCSVCPQGTYTHVDNRAPRCLPCKRSCHVTLQVVVKNCTSKNDTICRCKAGYWLRSKHDPWCLPHRRCYFGYGVVIPGTPFSDTTCEVCPMGTFSNEYSKSQKCQPHTNCQHYLSHGNSTHDSKCSVVSPVSTSRPSPSNGYQTVPKDVVDGVDSQESSTSASRGEESRNHTKKTSVPVVLGVVDTVVIAVGVTIVLCCLGGGVCGFLCWKYKWLKRLWKYFKGESSGEVVPQKDPNGNAMELAATDSADGAGEPRRSSEPEEIVISRNGSAGDGATCETCPKSLVSVHSGLIRRKSSGLQLSGKPDYKRSSSRNSDPETTPLFETGASEDDVFVLQPSPQLQVSPRRPLGKVKEMTQATFFHNAADFLQSDNWKRAMRTLPGTNRLTEKEIDTTYCDNWLNGISEVMYQCFVKWHLKNPNEDVVKSIADTLKEVVGLQAEELRSVKIIES